MSPAPMENIEKESILEALNSTAGNVKKAAELLQMNRRTLYRKLEKFGIDYNSIRLLKIMIDFFFLFLDII